MHLRSDVVPDARLQAQAGKLNPSVTAIMVGTNLNEGRYLMPLVMPVRLGFSSVLFVPAP